MNINKSLRILLRNRIYSLLNILGLAIGIASASLIFLWVENRININSTIPNSKNIYAVGQHQHYGDDIRTFFVSPGPLPETLENEFPEVKRVVRVNDNQPITFSPEGSENVFVERGYYADSTLFGMISLEFIRGSAQTAFKNNSSIVISELMAQKIFGNEDPISKRLETQEGFFEITGVFKDQPINTSFGSFDWAIPFKTLADFYIENGYVSATHWRSNWLYCYVETVPNANIDDINDRLANLIPSKIPGDLTELFIYPVNRIRLYNEFKDGIETGSGYIRTVRLFAGIGLVILLIACINFMNLSTARSQKRALEVGVRKTFGTKRRHLIQQFLMESGLITLISMLIAVGLVYLALPFFNNLVNIQLSIDWTNPYISGGLICISLLCALLAGSYPAFFLSSFAPLSALRKQKSSGSGHVAWVRQGLVVFQFAIAFILICSTLAVFKQIQFGQQRDLGFNKEDLVTYNATNEIRQSFDAVQNELINSGYVVNAGLSNSTLLNINYNGSGYRWEGKDSDFNPLITVNMTSHGLIETAGLEITEGSSLTSHHREWRTAIINQTLADMMGEGGRIGGKIGQSDNPEEQFEIVGIMKDFVFNNIYRVKSEPLIMINNKHSTYQLFVRLNPDSDPIEATAKVKAILQKFTPDEPFDAVFMEDHFERMFRSERLEGKLSALFAGLAIFISCLGLLGLSAFSAEQRTKEIGVRKVLGASTSSIVMLLAKSYMILIGIAFAIGIPIAVYITSKYLKNYAYHTTLDWLFFTSVALFITAIALLTVSSQSIKAALANPVKSIKSE